MSDPHPTPPRKKVLVERVCEYPGCGKVFVKEASRKARFCNGSCRTAWVNWKNAKPLAERFWRLVRKSEGCWLWVGKIEASGYGRIWIEGLKQEGAHRVSWELHNGPITDGLFVLHRCDVKTCVNPEHLFLGTQLDNMRDRLAKGKYARGDAHHSRRRTIDVAA